jgi:transglutaminase-like putative cysteine protease
VPDLRERLLYPRAGWLSLGLLAAMALALAWSVQGAAWLEQLDFLAPLAVWAVLAGALIGVLRWTIVVSLPLGALIGAALVLWTIGGEYFVALNQVGRLLALRGELIDWTVIVLETGYPPQMSPYALGIGALMWATAFTASYVVYRYHRVLDAILLLGAALIANMSATFTDLFGHLLLFVIAALLLWLRAALIVRQDGWQRRRVNENLEVPASILRSGIVFAGASVALAWILTSVAVAAPLTGAWRSLDGVWTGVRDQLEGVLGSLTNPQSRITGSSFGPSFTVFGEWVSNDEEVLILASDRPLYLRARTYDTYTGRGWEQSDLTSRDVRAGEPIFPTTLLERPIVASAADVSEIAIEMRQVIGRNVFTAGSPLRVFAPVIVQEPRGLPVNGALEWSQAPAVGETYTLQVALSRATEAELAVAGEDYEEEIRGLYLDTTGVTDRVAQLALDIVNAAGAETPYDQAKALADYLTGPEFTYATTGPEVPRDGDLVDTFLFGEGARSGYCQYYASAMAMMARSLGLPARVATGFAPGEAAGEGLTLVREANSHLWTEIYFPGYGWEIFEATKSINPAFVRSSGDRSTAEPPPRDGRDEIGGPQPIDEGAPPVGALASPVLVPGGIDPLQPDTEPSSGDTGRTGNVVVMLALLAGAGLVIWFQVRRSQRRWRLMPAGERAWKQLTLAADRAGVGPRPSETIYEYTGWLEDQLPKHVEPIRTVADGKVW